MVLRERHAIGIKRLFPQLYSEPQQIFYGKVKTLMKTKHHNDLNCSWYSQFGIAIVEMQTAAVLHYSGHLKLLKMFLGIEFLT